MTAPGARRTVEVALPLPLFRTFTYALENTPQYPVVPGTRVVVPVRTRSEIGVCVAVDRRADDARLRPVLDVPDAEPAFTRGTLELCRWAASYYVVPLGVVLRAALPALLTGVRAPRPVQRTRRVAVLVREVPSLAARDALFGRAARQRELFELLESAGGRLDVAHITRQLGFSASVLDGLVTRGLVTIEGEIAPRDPFAGRVAAHARQAHVPTAAQRNAIDALLAAEPGHAFLLHGITGSGKTLVYLEFLREVVERRGKGAILLVPEIALTPQTVDRVRAVFGDAVAVLHSGLSDGERYDAWLALRRGTKRIAVGARSAVFAPIADLGAIVVDEEHESTYKNGETPRYHAREMAIVRARAEGAVAVLGSATPSLESWWNAERGKYRLLTLPERAGAGRLPRVQVVDLRARHDRGEGDDAARRGGAPIGRRAGAHAGARTTADGADGGAAFALQRVLSPELEQALETRLGRGEQSILLLNRRGYASFVQCESCGTVQVCPDCSISLTYHRAPERLVCHYCLHEELPSRTCLRCGGTAVRHRGLGTQQVERLVAERFPAARIARMDVDTTSGKWAHADILDRVARGDVEILLGTQMIAKGLDFPNVTLVGIIDADVGMNLPDFRAAERSFQLMHQVAGRAGRGPKGGLVVIQTRMPSHYAVTCALAHDYAGFVRQELSGRRDPRYPPLTRLINVVVSGTIEEETADLALHAGDWLTRLLAARPDERVSVVGPAPCPIERIQRRWRWHLLLKGERAEAMTRVARYFSRRFEVPTRAGLRVVLDRDPVSLL
ncbi:MAG TPA: primosomal protein N' [Gemmatimonadaceae bacterium]|nr:primosomal protein N' [Gemmatimonadaceae bacterium]